LAACLLAVSARADVALPALFGPHCVLQRGPRVPIWGQAAPHEPVTVSIGGQSVQAEADDRGRWRTALDLADAGPGPFELVVTGRNRLVVPDVAIGEVWVCSGQSNMDWSVARTRGAAATIAASANPDLRVFTPVRQFSDHPLDSIEGQWQRAGPDATGGFPAVGYWFGRDVQAALHRPVGLVHLSWGGSPVESWTSQAALDTDPELKAGAARVLAQYRQYQKDLRAYVAAYDAWEKAYWRQGPAPADPRQFAAPDASTEGWQPVSLPGSLGESGLPDAGAVWLRRTFTITPQMAIGPLFINLGILRDFDSFYVNGVKVGETSPQTGGAASPRTYYMEVNAVRPGPVTLALRLVAPAGGAAVMGPDTAFNIDTVTLAGTWLAKPEYALPELSADGRAAYPAPMAAAPYPFRVPTWLFNGMIHPALGYAMRGVVWYQGEDNAPRAFQYRKAFPLMIEDWRRRWGEGAFPFYFCQLPKFGPVAAQPQDSLWAELREAQTRTLALPHTGEAVLIDLGEPGDIHPRNKIPVGDRLARLALARTYGMKIVDSGPVFAGMTVEGDALRIRFRHTEGGLVVHALPSSYRPMTVVALTRPLVLPAPDSQVQGFAVCGPDRRWVWADATIDGSDVVVRAPGIAHPQAVRYAWADSPVCNLFNGAGLPAAPFRTDDYPGLSDAVKFGFTP
jgi:sialate O-acetylesterase